jgi:hypothetical protein
MQIRRESGISAPDPSEKLKTYVTSSKVRAGVVSYT